MNAWGLFLGQFFQCLLGWLGPWISPIISTGVLLFLVLILGPRILNLLVKFVSSTLQKIQLQKIPDKDFNLSIKLMKTHISLTAASFYVALSILASAETAPWPLLSLTDSKGSLDPQTGMMPLLSGRMANTHFPLQDFKGPHSLRGEC